MTESIFTVIGREKAMELIRGAVTEAQAVNIAFGVVTADVHAAEMKRLEAEGLSPQEIDSRMDTLRNEQLDRSNLEPERRAELIAGAVERYMANQAAAMAAQETRGKN